MVANGDTPEAIRDHPALAGIELPRTGSPRRAGLLLTKTLLFSASGEVLFAHDKGTGEVVAEIPLPARYTGVPMIYTTGGRQFIVVAVAGRGNPAELVALALPRGRN